MRRRPTAPHAVEVIAARPAHVATRRVRIFDHLEGTPEDRLFSRVAHTMCRGELEHGALGPTAWWWRLPERDEPTEVHGEIER